MTVLEYMPVSRRVQILDDGDRMKAAMESLFEKEDPSFRITIMKRGSLVQDHHYDLVCLQLTAELHLATAFTS